MNVLSVLRQRLEAALAPLLPATPEGRAGLVKYGEMLKPAQDTRFGDFQANCAMPLGKELGRPPREVATQILDGFKVDDLCLPPEVAGPGFINLRLKQDWLEAQATALVIDPRLGVASASSPERIIVDYSAPNVAKPMHVGHLRSTVIGHALYRILKFLGHTVISDNHIGDWGTQFGMIIYGYKHFRDDAAYAARPVQELARLYRLVNQLSDYHGLTAEIPRLESSLAETQQRLTEAEADSAAAPKDADKTKAAKKLRGDVAELQDTLKSAVKKRQDVETSPELKAFADAHPQIAELARKETAKLHAGDAENLRLWNEFVPECLKALEGVYERFGVRFDLTRGESYYNPQLDGVVRRLVDQGYARESEGALCVFIEGNRAPFIVKKTDGAFTYATTDLATLIDRVENPELKADRVLYVVDSRQSEHFELLEATGRLAGILRPETELKHVSFGTVLGEDKRPYKTRSGDVVGLESLLDEAVARAMTIVSTNDDGKPTGAELDEAARAQIAEIVGIGGIIYADLHHNRESDYVFSWDKMLATKGDTATYMQYAYARVNGIFRKGDLDRDEIRRQGGRVILEHADERALALQLLRFDEALQDVCHDYRPHLLTAYLFELANRFSAFFESCSVLKEPDEERRRSRLLLCCLTADVIAKGLDLLGIQVAEKM